MQANPLARIAQPLPKPSAFVIPFNFLETIRTAFIALASNKLRTILTMLGVIIGVGSVVTLLSIGNGITNFISSRINSIGADLLTISPDNRQGGEGARLTNADVLALQDPLNVSGVVNVVPQVSGGARVSVGTQVRQTQINGTTPDFFVVRTLNMTQGEVFSQNDIDLRVRVCVLGATVAQALFGSDAQAINQTVIINSSPFRVVGVAEAKGGFGPGGGFDDTVYVPLTVAQEKLFVGRGTGLRSVNQITFQMADPSKSAQVIDDIVTLLRSQHKLLPGQADDFRVTNQAEIASTMESVTTGLTIFLGIVGGISLLVGGIGIMNIMLVSVTERTREIGLRKAIGARRSTILWQFMIESLTVSAMAGLIGMIFGSALSIAAGPTIARTLQATAFTPRIEAPTLLVAFSFAVIVGVVFGLYPAWRASRLVPVAALRYE
jgi:putative ABC transport system permease protein